MTPNPDSGRRARQNGISGEKFANVEDTLIRIGDNHAIIDGEHGVEVKTLQACVIGDPDGNERSGRFRFSPHQQEHLLEIDGKYRFLVVTPDEEVKFACERQASELDIPTDRPSTMTLHQVCPAVVGELSCPILRRK